MSKRIDGKMLKKLKGELNERLCNVEREIDEELTTDKMQVVFMLYKVSKFHGIYTFG